MDVRDAIERELICLRQVDPAELTPGEFAHQVRTDVGQNETRLLVIDSLNGYLNAMPEANFLTAQLHELLTDLGQRDIATILISTQHGLLSTVPNTDVDVSYLADAVILLRYFEMDGEVRKSISVVKKRTGRHERTIREYQMSSEGLRVGPPLGQFRDVLGGAPVYQEKEIPDVGGLGEQ